jgi:teichuronic acid biosynthesis glycosyltransferase TuaG
VTDHPRISVLTCAYNSERYIGECLSSVLGQTLLPFEMIVCDDHSSDRTWSIIEQFAGKYPELVRAYRHDRNLGQQHNGDFARSKVRGEYVTWIDGDDRWVPQKLELEWKALREDSSADVAYSNVYAIDENGSRLAVWDDGGHPRPPSGDAFVRVFSRRFFPNAGSLFRDALMRRSASDGEFHADTSLQSFWDWDIKIRLAARYRLAYVRVPGVEYRIHGKGFHAQDAVRHVRAMIQVYEKNAGLLEGRPLHEQLMVRCHVEASIAQQLLRIPAADRPERYLPTVSYARNRDGLRELPAADDSSLTKEVRVALAHLAIAGARERLGRGNLGGAMWWLTKAARDSPKAVLTTSARRLKNLRRSSRRAVPGSGEAGASPVGE